jgi:hypothetical protein
MSSLKRPGPLIQATPSWGPPLLWLVNTHVIPDAIGAHPSPYHPQSCSSLHIQWPPHRWDMGWWSLHSLLWVPESLLWALSLCKGKRKGENATAACTVTQQGDNAKNCFLSKHGLVEGKQRYTHVPQTLKSPLFAINEARSIA